MCHWDLARGLWRARPPTGGLLDLPWYLLDDDCADFDSVIVRAAAPFKQKQQRFPTLCTFNPTQHISMDVYHIMSATSVAGNTSKDQFLPYQKPHCTCNPRCTASLGYM